MLYNAKLSIVLQSSVFTCQTIVVLKLYGLYVSALSSVCLPLLKKLHLEVVDFHDCGSVPKLFSSQASFPKLISADIDSVYILWTVFHMVEFLRLRMDMMEDVCHNVKETFTNLVHVEFNMEVYVWNVIAGVLENSPKIQILVIIKENLPISHQIRNDFVTAKRIPSSLRKCQMEGFEGEKCELQFAKYIMENVTALTTMKISADTSTFYDKFQMIKELSSYKRMSSECQLLFE